MKTLLVATALFLGVTLYDYNQPRTCKVTAEYSILGNLGLFEKCQTPWGVYYKERLIRYL